MRNKLFFLILICNSIVGFSQEKLIKGRIIIDILDAPAEGIHVTNTRTKYTSITDLTGNFALNSRLGDTLLIRSAFYETRKFEIKESVFKKASIDIHLNMQPVILDEARLSPKLTGYLDKDAKISNRKDPVAEIYKQLGVNPDKKIRRDTTSFALGKDVSPFHLNVEKLADLISGDLRRRQNLYKYEATEIKIQEIRAFFGDDYFTLDLGIPQEKIREFIFFSFETTDIPKHYETKNYFNIMSAFLKTKNIYLQRLKTQKRL